MTFEPEVGLPLYINGKYVECVEDKSKDEMCANCAFQDSECTNVVCAAGRRHDKKNVHFEEDKISSKKTIYHLL